MTLRQRFKAWWCKRFHNYAGYWWGETPSGSAIYCCKCGRELEAFSREVKP